MDAELTEEGRSIEGRQVTVRAGGRTTRIDTVTRAAPGEGAPMAHEAKTGGARLSPGQRALDEAIRSGEPVIPRGERAREAGLTPGEPVVFDRAPSGGTDVRRPDVSDVE